MIDSSSGISAEDYTTPSIFFDFRGKSKLSSSFKFGNVNIYKSYVLPFSAGVS